jgi:hypothetical protein
VRGRYLAIAGAVALAASLPASAARNSVEHFTVASAKVGATLSFHSANSAQSTQTNGTVVLSASQKSRGKGSLPGRALAALKGTLKERVTTKQAQPDSNPYQETCANSRKIGGKGGLTLRRVGNKVQAGWAFPQAKVSFCQGPKVGKSVTAKMKRVYSSSTFNKKRVTVVLKGTSTSHSGKTTLIYRWNARVTLARS